MLLPSAGDVMPMRAAPLCVPPTLTMLIFIYFRLFFDFAAAIADADIYDAARLRLEMPHAVTLPHTAAYAITLPLFSMLRYALFRHFAASLFYHDDMPRRFFFAPLRCC